NQPSDFNLLITSALSQVCSVPTINELSTPYALDNMSGRWLLPYLPLAQQVLHATKSQPLHDVLNAARSAGCDTMRFVDHSELSRHEAYEAFIARTGRIPTRQNLHDLFNGVMWLTWPQTKQRLNVLQAQAIAERGSAGPRGKLRDALTV